MARPPKEIDWNVVEKFMEAGCSGIQIAGEFRIRPDTLYIRFKKEYGCSFQDYRVKAEEAGLGKIKLMLYSKALNNNNPGNSNLLMFLAKCKLGYKEPEQSTSLAANQTQIDQSHLIMQLQHELSELKMKLSENFSSKTDVLEEESQETSEEISSYESNSSYDN